MHRALKVFVSDDDCLACSTVKNGHIILAKKKSLKDYPRADKPAPTRNIIVTTWKMAERIVLTTNRKELIAV